MTLTIRTSSLSFWYSVGMDAFGNIAIGNLFSLLGEAFLVVSATASSKGRTIVWQSIALLSIAVANLTLGGYVGALVNVIGIGRNILFLHDRDSLAVRVTISVVLLALSLTISLSTGFADRLFWLPLSANLLYTMCGHLQGGAFKSMCAVNFALWMPYDLLLGNYVSCGTDTMNAVLSARTAFVLHKGEQPEDDTGQGDDGTDPQEHHSEQPDEVVSPNKTP